MHSCHLRACLDRCSSDVSFFVVCCSTYGIEERPSRQAARCSPSARVSASRLSGHCRWSWWSRNCARVPGLKA